MDAHVHREALVAELDAIARQAQQHLAALQSAFDRYQSYVRALEELGELAGWRPGVAVPAPHARFADLHAFIAALTTRPLGVSS